MRAARVCGATGGCCVSRSRRPGETGVMAPASPGSVSGVVARVGDHGAADRDSRGHPGAAGACSSATPRSSGVGSSATTTPRPSCGWACYRKGHPEAGLTWEEAVREALCWGWIDSLAQGIDEHTVASAGPLARRAATGRRSTSPPSPSSRRRAGCSRAASRRSRCRREDRSGVYAYENRDLELAEPYAARARRRPGRGRVLGGGDAVLPQVAVNWVMTAKQEKTRDARAATLVDDCAAGRLIKGQRYGTPPTWVERAAAAAEAARLG